MAERLLSLRLSPTAQVSTDLRISRARQFFYRCALADGVHDAVVVDRMPAADDGLQPQRRSEARVEPRVLSRHHFPYTALDPVKKAPFEVMARDTRLRFLASRGLGALTEANETVREVLLRPLKVFSGIRKDEDESPDGDGWLCYVGKPKKRYRHATGAPYPPQSNALFLVYVTHERVVYNWRWEDEDDHNPGYPKDCENRYRTLVFP